MSTLKKLSPAFCAVINESARKIFGNLPVVNYRTGLRQLKQKPYGPVAASYWPADSDRAFRDNFEDFQTDIEERRELKLDAMRRKGKGPPKKGQGKRAMKKKK